MRALAFCLHLKEKNQKRSLSFQRIESNQEHLRVHLRLYEILRLDIFSLHHGDLTISCHRFCGICLQSSTPHLGTINVRSNIVEALRSKICNLNNDGRLVYIQNRKTTCELSSNSPIVKMYNADQCDMFEAIYSRGTMSYQY